MIKNSKIPQLLCSLILGLQLLTIPTMAWATGGPGDAVYLLLGYMFVVGPVSGVFLVLSFVSFVIGRNQELTSGQLLYGKIVYWVTLVLLVAENLVVLGFAVPIGKGEVFVYAGLLAVSSLVFAIPCLLLARRITKRG